MTIELDETKLRHPSTGVLQEVIASSSVRAFNSGFEHGARLERQRITEVVKAHGSEEFTAELVEAINGAN